MRGVKSLRGACSLSECISGVTELHLHLEGSLSVRSAIEIAKLRSHRWAMLTESHLRRSFRYENFLDFLGSIREMCRVLCSVDALERAAYELSHSLARSGVLYAEVYSSPYIFVRWGLKFSDVLRAVDSGYARAESEGGARCMILLDSVRQWGPEAARLVLDLYAADPIPRVIGFGLGGEESIPLEDFRAAFDEVRALGLRAIAHAGECGPPSDVAVALEVLGVERVAHGIRVTEDPVLTQKVAAQRVPFDVAITSNYRTRVVRGVHPIRKLIDAGIVVSISTDDPSLFRTDLPREFRRAMICGGVTRAEQRTIAYDSVTASFAPEDMKRMLRQELDRRFTEPGR